MLKYFIQVVQEMTAPAIIMALMFLVAGTIRNPNERAWLFKALLISVVCAIVVAVLKQNTRLVNQEWLNLYTLTAALAAAVAYLIWLCLHLLAGTARPDGDLCGGLSFVLMLAVSFYPLPNYLLHPTDFVLSDQSMFSTDFLYRALGYAAATLLVALLSISFYQVLARFSRRTLALMAVLVLAVAAIGWLGTLVQFMLARRILPFSPPLFAFVKFTVNHADVLVYAMLTITLVPALVLFARNLREHGYYHNPAEHRKLLASAMHSRRWSSMAAVLFVIAVLDLSVVQSYANQGFTLSPVEEHRLEEGLVHIPLEQVSDQHLHRFAHLTEDGTQIRWIIIKKQGAAFGVGFDACEICGPTGYYERNGQVVCMLCDVVMNINTIGYKGGCNPIPLPYSIDQGEIVIDLEDILAEKKRFE